MLTAARPTPATYAADASIGRFTVKQYQRMIESGALTRDDRVELLEGYVVLKMPANPPHDGTTLRIGKRLRRHLPAGWDIRTQSTLELADSQPEPDIAVVRELPDDYTSRHPTPADAGLVVEVADSSLLRDQRDKARMYARDRVVCYWIVNIPDRQVEAHTQPSGPADAPAYASVQVYRPGDLIPLELDGTPVGPVPAADLLP